MRSNAKAFSVDVPAMLYRVIQVSAKTNKNVPQVFQKIAEVYSAVCRFAYAWSSCMTLTWLGVLVGLFVRTQILYLRENPTEKEEDIEAK